MIKEMRKVQIIGPKAYLDECIKVLHAASVLHIETIPVEEETPVLKRLPVEKEKLKEKEALEKAVEVLRGLLFLLKAPQSYRAVKVRSDEIYELLDEAADVEKDAAELRARKDSLSEELSAIYKYERLLLGFAPIVSRLGGLKNFEIVGLTVEKTREEIAGLIEEEIKKITGGSYQIYLKDLDETALGIVLTYPRKYDVRIKYLLSGKSISEIRLPDEYASFTLIDALKTMAKKKEELPRSIEEAERGLERISERWYGMVAGLMRAVEGKLEELGALTYAAQTKFTFVIEGWAPLDMLEGLRARVSALLGEKIVLRELYIGEKEIDRIPVCIKNPGFIKPFEVFLAALPSPRYGSVDPTPYVALFFPAFFGLVVGDAGYGAVMLAVSLYLRRRLRANEMLSDMLFVLSVSSVSAIIFGILFGEFFGDLGMRLGLLHPVLFHRTEALKTLIVLMIGIGAGHVLLGILIGLLNHLFKKRIKEAGAKLAFLILVIAFLGIAGVILGYLPKSLFKPGLITAAVAFALLTALEGVMGPLEFIKALGNILSYIRIMAVGTASVVMAIVANRIGSLFEDLLIGIIVAGFIHLLNLMLSVLSPSIQSMRLHYVEFFSKFYEGGGRKYVPFGKK